MAFRGKAEPINKTRQVKIVSCSDRLLLLTDYHPVRDFDTYSRLDDEVLLIFDFPSECFYNEEHYGKRPYKSRVGMLDKLLSSEIQKFYLFYYGHLVWCHDIAGVKFDSFNFWQWGENKNMSFTLCCKGVEMPTREPALYRLQEGFVADNERKDRKLSYSYENGVWVGSKSSDRMFNGIPSDPEGLHIPDELLRRIAY